MSILVCGRRSLVLPGTKQKAVFIARQGHTGSNIVYNLPDMMFSKQGLMFISADKFCPHANRFLIDRGL
jgi:hypothetical protein